MRALHTLLIAHLLACLGPNADGSKIINGTKAAKNSMPYMAALLSGSAVACGGFLIRDDFVLTAAHCVHVTHVVLGTNNVRDGDGLKLSIVKAIKHECYDSNNLKKGWDIMLLKLQTKVPLGGKIKTIDLSTTAIGPRVECQVAGWGAIKSNGAVVDDLTVVDVSTVGLKACQDKWLQLSDNVICAGGHDTGKGFCQGDSGGPLVCNGKAAGIVSFNCNKRCDYKEDSELPNVYTDVSKYVDWIRENIIANE
ncbi:trypsin-like [Cyclopterus lumpus]|uniref:Peptidase S1 domain-containing protein n=1 Tax=Cyclopterus lumpus TaxID=8103 RepID=A0A8C2WA69_CYCLU|nr:trypsin-like [Cyclopterus lumpus]